MWIDKERARERGEKKEAKEREGSGGAKAERGRKREESRPPTPRALVSQITNHLFVYAQNASNLALKGEATHEAPGWAVSGSEQSS